MENLILGDGSGYGDGDGIKAFCGKAVYLIDGIQTIIRKLKGNIAKGVIWKALRICQVLPAVLRQELLTSGPKGQHEDRWSDRVRRGAL